MTPAPAPHGPALPPSGTLTIDGTPYAIIGQEGACVRLRRPNGWGVSLLLDAATGETGHAYSHRDLRILD